MRFDQLIIFVIFAIFCDFEKEVMLWITTLIAVTRAADPSCLSSKLSLSESRYKSSATADFLNYDLFAEYGGDKVAFASNGFTITMPRNDSGQSLSAQVSSTRFILYGKLTVRMSANALPGLAAAFYTMSDQKDSINW